MPLRILLVFLFSIQITQLSSQFLDKSYYLIDSLDKSKINKNDFDAINSQLKLYHQSKNDSLKLLDIQNLIEKVNEPAIWTKYNAFIYKISKEKQKTVPLNQKRAYRIFEANAYNNIGYYFYNYTEKIDSALFYYKKGVELNEECNNYAELIIGYSNVANVYQNSGRIIEALELMAKSLSLEDKVSDKSKLIAPYNNIANIYLFLNDTVNALKNLKLAFAISRKFPDKNMMSHLLHNIGTLNRNNNYTESLQSIKKAYHLRKEIGDLRGISQSLISLSGFAIKVKNLGLARQYLEELEPILPQLNNQYVTALYYRSNGELLAQEGKYDASFDNFEKSFALLTKLDSKIDLLTSVNEAIGIFKDMDKFKSKVFDLYKLSSSLSTTLNRSAVQKITLQSQYQNQLKDRENELKIEQAIKDEKNKLEKRRQQYFTIGVLFILGIVLVFSFFIYRALKLNKEKNIIIGQQKLEVEKQKHFIEEKQKEIIDSINYSKRIQNSFLPSQLEFTEAFPEAFVIYQPKDIVSGDFYWIVDSKNYSQIEEKFQGIAVADCTGHGVPGSMLSMLGASILNQGILESSVRSPSDILNFLNSELKKTLRSTSNEIIRDGMDISCCVFFPETFKMLFSGANNPCWIVREEKIIELKATKQAVTAYNEDVVLPFTTTEIQLQKNDLVVLFTDGYADQFGGPKGKKFKYKQLENILIESAQLPKEQIQSILINKFNNWKGSLEQVDDVCIIGIRV